MYEITCGKAEVIGCAEETASWILQVKQSALKLKTMDTAIISAFALTL